MSEQSTQRPQRPARITALLSLVDRLLADPITAHLAGDGIWTVNRTSISLIDHANDETAERELGVIESLLSAKFVPGDKSSVGDWIAHELKSTWQGYRLSVTLFAPGQSAEETLRARVTELETELAAERARWKTAAASTIELRPLVISDETIRQAEAIEAQYGADEASR